MLLPWEEYRSSEVFCIYRFVVLYCTLSYAIIMSESEGCCRLCRNHFRLEIQTLKAENMYLRERISDIQDSIDEGKPRYGLRSWLGRTIPRQYLPKCKLHIPGSSSPAHNWYDWIRVSGSILIFIVFVEEAPSIFVIM